MVDQYQELRMDIQENKQLKALASGVVLTTDYDDVVDALTISALYAPGVSVAGGQREHFVKWCVVLHRCMGGQKVYTAMAFKWVTGGGLADLSLSAFCDSGELHALRSSELLEGLGLAHDLKLSSHDGWRQLNEHPRPSDDSIGDFTSQSNFLDAALARKCASARLVLRTFGPT
jgi:hypothetical protein